MKGNKKIRNRFWAIMLLFVVTVVIAFPRTVGFWPALKERLEKFEISLGLDLQGGIHLEYLANTSEIEDSKKAEALQAVQDVVERRVNAFGVGEPLVQTSKSGNEDRLIVELPGVADVEEAKSRIKDTPILEFRQEAGPESEGQKTIDNLNSQSRNNFV